MIPIVPSPSKLSIERLVALLTPLFVAAGGAISTGAGAAVGIPSKDLIALFIAGATAGLGAALKWLDGRAKFVQFKGDVEGVVHQAVAGVMANQQAGPALADIEAVLKAHTAQIVTAIGSAVHAPPSVEQVVQQMAAQLSKAPPQVALGVSDPALIPPTQAA